MRAQDLERVARALDEAQKAREKALAYRESQRDDQRRQRMRREAELEAAKREEAELADNMISNLDRAYREQEQAAALVREVEARQVDTTELELESRTRAPYRSSRASQHLELSKALERESWEQVEREAMALAMTEEDMERRVRASCRIQRALDDKIGMSNGSSRQLRGVDMRSLHGGAMANSSDCSRRSKLGTEALAQQSEFQVQQQEANDLAQRYAGAEYTLADEAAALEDCHTHHTEEYDFSYTAAGGSGPVPLQDRALRREVEAQGRLFSNVLLPRDEMEVARAAKKALEKEEKLTSLEAARCRREQAEYLYAARKVQYSQLEARHEQLLGEATPALAAAQHAAASLQPAQLTELYHAPNPTAAVQATLVAAHVLLTRGAGAATFDAACKRLGYPDLFIDELRSFDCDQLPESALERVSSMMRELDVDEVLMQSPVSGTILLWVANIARYNEVYRLVRPVRVEMQQTAIALEDMDEARRAAAKKLSFSLAWQD